MKKHFSTKDLILLFFFFLGGGIMLGFFGSLFLGGLVVCLGLGVFFGFLFCLFSLLGFGGFV